MGVMSLGSGTRKALVFRVVLGILVGLPVAGLALLHLGWASAFGFVAAVPAGYLLHAAVKDGRTLLGREHPVERPRFLWFVIAGVLCFGYWSTLIWA
jgi:hypothetical protein